ncbi:MAG TPA: alpha/beta fold hydrolase [Steroidobacteraceae bacterium]|nr:alpha/beta fold hydrolase [Steroidobacteraceae bacterium]
MERWQTVPDGSGDTLVDIDDRTELGAFITLPDAADGLVVFVHGSGSSRFSRRNRRVAEFLAGQGFATLLMDLLTPAEERIDSVTRELRFDIPMLARRVGATLGWLSTRAALQSHPIGLFGASTGAAAALIAAAEHPETVSAVVSRGGRPDLAGDALGCVRAPTLLIVGGADPVVMELNRAAAQRITAPHELLTIPGATHLFEEPGALEKVAQAATDWFARHLRSRPGDARS